MNKDGKLIVLYGINNLGKSTQAKLLVERLKANGYQAQYLKYPIYDLAPSGNILNDYLRNSNPHNLHSREAQIIYALNRTQYQSELISKLKAGINIVAEDYKGTGIAWGLGAGVDEKFLKNLNSHLVNEDLAFLFDGARFRQAIEKNHKHENNDDLTNKVRWAHLKLQEEYGWIKINANETIETIHEKLWQITLKLLNEGKPEETTPAPKSKPEKYHSHHGFEPLHEIINNNYTQSFSQTTNSRPTKKPKEVGSTRLKIERLNPLAKLPQKAHTGDAAFDLYATDYYSLPPYGQDLIATGLKLAIPENHVGLIFDKSGLASLGITTLGGVIDSNYRGEIKVILKNLSEDIFNVIPGQKIAQLLIEKITDFKISEEKISDKTERQDGGFGSSGQF